MKKSILILIMILFIPGVVLAEDIKNLDGYWWESLDKNFKVVLLGAFIGGHRYGENEGMNTGYIIGVSEALLDVRKETNIDFNHEEIFKRHLNKGFSGTNYTVSLKNVNELDAFYKTYPLCKSRELMEMLSDVIKVWREDEFRKTYKEIGEKCAE